VLSGTNKGLDKLASAGITHVQALSVTMLVPWMRVARRRRIEIIIVQKLEFLERVGGTNISSELKKPEIDKQILPCKTQIIQ
jgi:hypothetical protein